MERIELPQKPALRAAIADDHGRARAKSYDLLRTRILPEITERAWTRIGVAQAVSGPASALTALNLALSEARRPGRRVALVDLDVTQQPVLGRLGQAPLAEGPAKWRALTERAALLSIPAPAEGASTMLLSARFAEELSDRLAQLAPDQVILHLPPLMEGDAGLAALPLTQTVLLTIDGRRDTAGVLRRCEEFVTRHCPLLGVFLHNAEA